MASGCDFLFGDLSLNNNINLLCFIVRSQSRLITRPSGMRLIVLFVINNLANVTFGKDKLAKLFGKVWWGASDQFFVQVGRVVT